MALGLVVGTAALLPSAAAAPPGGVNRPPLKPTDVRFDAPAALCTTGDQRPALRTATPTVEAVHRDRDGDAVAAAVEVYELTPTGRSSVWSASSTPQASGTVQGVTVGGLEHDGLYQLRVASVDTSSRRGPSVTCEFEVDLVAPGLPSVAAVAVGSQPVYLPGVPAGGVGVPGSFVLGDGGSTDVVSYRYSLGGSDLGSSAVGSSPTITVTPTSPGTTTLHVQSVDRAGWVSPVATYDLVVAFTSASPQTVTWLLDEPSGTVAASVAGDGSDPLPLAVSPSLAARVPGFRAVTTGSTTDLALDFDGADDDARTSGPAVDTTGSYTVSASVRPTSVAGTATVLRQDGAATSGFRLGYQPCESGAGSCWAFSVPTSDAAAADETTVLSSVPAEAGSWVEVTGVHDDASGTLALWVCHPVVDDFGDAAWALTEAGSVTSPSPWAATGSLRLGGATWSQESTWSGAVGEVRVAATVPTQGELVRRCPAA